MKRFLLYGLIAMAVAISFVGLAPPDRAAFSLCDDNSCVSALDGATSALPAMVVTDPGENHAPGLICDDGATAAILLVCDAGKNPSALAKDEPEWRFDRQPRSVTNPSKEVGRRFALVLFTPT